MKKLLQNGFFIALLFTSSLFAAYDPGDQTPKKYKCSNCKSTYELKPTSCSFCYSWSFEELKETSVKKQQTPSNAQVPQNYPSQHTHAASGNQGIYVDKVCSNCDQTSRAKKEHRYCTRCGSYSLQSKETTSVKKYQTPSNAQVLQNHPSQSANSIAKPETPLSSIYGTLGLRAPQASSSMHKSYNLSNNTQNNSTYKPIQHTHFTPQPSVPYQGKMPPTHSSNLSLSPHPSSFNPPFEPINLQKEYDNFLEIKPEIEKLGEEIKKNKERISELEKKLIKLKEAGDISTQKHHLLERNTELSNLIKKNKELIIKKYYTKQKIDYIIDFAFPKKFDFTVGANKNVFIGTLLHFAVQYYTNNEELKLPVEVCYLKISFLTKPNQIIEKQDLNKKLCELCVFQENPYIKIKTSSNSLGASSQSESMCISLKEDISKYPAPSISSNSAAYYTAGIVLIKGIVQKKALDENMCDFYDSD